MEKLPTFSVDLIKQLDQEYPHRCPSLTDSDRLIWFKAGQRSVVDKLLALKAEAEQNAYEDALKGS